MAKVRQGRGSPSGDNRGPSRPQNDRNRSSNRNQSGGYQGNREGQNRNRQFEERNRDYQNREDQNSDRQSDNQNRNYRNREGQGRNRGFDERESDSQNRGRQDRNHGFNDRNRGAVSRHREEPQYEGDFDNFQDNEKQNRNRAVDDQNRRSGNRTSEGRGRNRDFENRDRVRSNSENEESTDTDREPSSEGRDLLVFGKNTVMSYLERMCLDEESDEQTQQIIKIFLADGTAPDERIRKINSLAKHLKIPVVACHPNKLDWMVQEGGRHQGVAAQVSPITLLEFSDWIAGMFQSEKEMLTAEGKGLDGYIVVALDGIEDPRNVGAIIRSAEAQGAKVILIPERRAAQVTETVAKTSAGAVVHIPIVRVVNLVKAIEELKQHGFWVLGLTADAPQPLYKVDLKRPLVIVVGSEGKGMRPLVRTNCDLLGAIPLNGKTESLNASVALGIAVYESIRQNSSK